MKETVNMPEWLKLAADNALIDASDMYKLFGYKSHGVFSAAYSRRPANIPAHKNAVEYKTYRGRVVEKFVWQAKDVRDFIKKQLAKNNENK